MIDLMGDTELDLLILPVVVTTVVFGQAIKACVKCLPLHLPFSWKITTS